ncbi:MAG: hypothetical protein R3F25_08025 [Gammaproteobacteria bacterium]
MAGKVLTTNQKEIIWNYWKQGIAMIDISRILNIRTSVSILLFYHGGIKPYNRREILIIYPFLNVKKYHEGSSTD